MVARKPSPPTGQTPQDDSVVFQKFAGLKNTVAAERLGPDELEFAINVDIDDAGQLHRRRGKTRVASGKFHSLWDDMDGKVFCVVNGNLSLLNPDFSTTTLDTGYSTDPINGQLAFVQVGPQIYFSSRYKSGIIDTSNGYAVSPWQGNPASFFYSPVVNPTPNLAPIGGRLLGPPPLATFLAYWNGRIYGGMGKSVWSTELWLYNYIDRTKNYWMLEAPLAMIGSVTDGVYVGTTEGVWFVSGVYEEAKRVRIMDAGVVPGSMVYIPGEVANPPQVGLQEDTPVKVSILFLTNEGYCGGQDGGVCYNYSENKYVFPDAASAVALYRKQDGMHQYLVSGNSGGTPSANARIGDFLDAQLIRRGQWSLHPENIKIHDSLSPTWIHH